MNFSSKSADGRPALHGLHGLLAMRCCAKHLPLQVLRSQAGYYIGTADDSGPCSRESAQYFAKLPQAKAALSSGGWTQRRQP